MDSFVQILISYILYTPLHVPEVDVYAVDQVYAILYCINYKNFLVED